MFVGHFAAAFAAKKAAPKASLAALLVATSWADILFSLLLLAGLERARVAETPMFMPVVLEHMPWSHSLLMSLVWAAAGAFLYMAATGYAAGARAVGLCVLSHWVLDALSHRPDMPVLLHGPKVGLGLWTSRPLTLAVEGAFYLWSLSVYRRVAAADDRAGLWAFRGLAALLALLYIGTFFAPPPPDVKAMAWTNLGGVLLLLWAWWFDRKLSILPGCDSSPASSSPPPSS